MNPPDEVVTLAVQSSLHSPCRSKRGCVIWNDWEIISSGFNHQPSPVTCDGSDQCKSSCRQTAIHAEQSAVLNGLPSHFFSFASMLHVKTVNGLIVASGPPSCLECSKLILETGISFMWLFHANGWKQYTAVEFHTETLKFRSDLRLGPTGHTEPFNLPDEELSV